MNCANSLLAQQMNVSNSSDSTSWSYQESAGAVSFIIVACVGIIGCFTAVLVLGKEFFTGRTSTLVIVASLTWIDFAGVLSTSAIVFRGLVVENGWIGEYPQCQIQAFSTCSSCICSGSIVTFMAIDRTVSLYKPFFYKTAASPNLARAICISILSFCCIISSLPFMGLGSYVASQSASYVCHFDWYSHKSKDKSFILILGILAAVVILAMLISNIIVFTLVWKLKHRVCKIVPSQMKTSTQRKFIAAKKEEQMAEFVASVSLIFLVTWLPLTVRFFCNFFEVLPSYSADIIANKLAASSFVANPFTYVIFRSIFKRSLRKSVSAVQNSFSYMMFNRTRIQVFPERLSTFEENRDVFTSRIVTDILDPRFMNPRSDFALQSTVNKD